MKVYFGTDHAGFELKEQLIAFVRDELGHDVEDMGAHAFDADDDYPDLIVPVARAVAADARSRAIIFGGSGQGEAIAANRVAGARAALWYGGSDEILTLSRTHNDANILSIGARFVSFEDASRAVRMWLETEFSDEERHARRIEKIDAAVHT